MSRRVFRIVVFVALCTFSLSLLSGCGPGVAPQPPSGSEFPNNLEVARIVNTNDPSADLLVTALHDQGNLQEMMMVSRQNGVPNLVLYTTDGDDSIGIIPGDDGLPLYMLLDSEGNYLHFENYTGNTVDITLFDPNDRIIGTKETISVNPSDIEELKELYLSTETTRNWRRTTATVLRWSSIAFSVAGCAASIKAAVVTAGLAVPLAYLSCTSALLSVVEQVAKNDESTLNERLGVNSRDLAFTLAKPDLFSIAGWGLGALADIIDPLPTPRPTPVKDVRTTVHFFYRNGEFCGRETWKNEGTVGLTITQVRVTVCVGDICMNNSAQHNEYLAPEHNTTVELCFPFPYEPISATWTVTATGVWDDGSPASITVSGRLNP